MEDKSLSEKVSDWFHKTGLPLELETASSFKAAGFEVTHSSVYADPETDKGREIDVVAYTRDAIGLIQIFFVVECKASPNPWVILTNKEQNWGLSYFSLGVHSQETREAIPTGILTARSQLGELLSELHTGGYAIRQAFCKDNDPAYAAAITVLKAATIQANEQPSKTPRLNFALPVLVVDSPIYECSVSDSGKLKFRQVKISEFLFTAYIPERTRSVIRVVSKEALPLFTSHCFAISEKLKGVLAYKVDEYKRSLTK